MHGPHRIGLVVALSLVSGAASAAPLHSVNEGWEDDGTVVRLKTDTDFVGIGTRTPAGKLQVTGGNSIFDGNVGIGTTSPGQPLTIAGDLSASYPNAGSFSADHVLFSHLEGGAYMGRVGVKENQWALTHFGTTWTPRQVNGYWLRVAMSSDGKIQTAAPSGDQLYVSIDYGATWTAKGPGQNWWGVAMSSDGKVQTAVSYDPLGKIYVSTDYGDTWTLKGPEGWWRDVAMSADGRIQTAVNYYGPIYVSTDYGDTWTPRESGRSWYGIAMSSDGKIQTAAGSGPSQLYVSTDYGNTWTPRESDRLWYGVAMSSDGRIQTASVIRGQLYISTDYGTTWTPKASSDWRDVAMSSDGRIQTAVADQGQIYVSTDYGNTWTPQESSRRWWGVAMSSDGRIQTAAVEEGDLYVSYADAYLNDGKVGLGTANPEERLDLGGGNIKMGYQVVTVSQSDTYYVYATCPTGKKILGGGCTKSGAYVPLLLSSPAADTAWMCQWIMDPPYSGILQATAICANIR